MENQTIPDTKNQFKISEKSKIIESELFMVEHSVINWLENSLKTIVKNAHLYHTLTHTAQTNVICSILVIIGRKIESLVGQEKERNEENNYTDIGGLKNATLSLPGYSNLNSNSNSKILSPLDNSNSNSSKIKGQEKAGLAIAIAEVGGGAGVGRQEKALSRAQSMSVLRCTASQLLSSYRGVCLSLLSVDVVKETSKFR